MKSQSIEGERNVLRLERDDQDEAESRPPPLKMDYFSWCRICVILALILLGLDNVAILV